MQRRTPILILFLFFTCNFLYSNPVDIKTAKEVGRVFLKASSMSSSKGMDDLTLLTTYSSEMSSNRKGVVSDPLFYIFEIKDAPGYIIIAADDRVTPVLGYSLNSNYIIDDIPPALSIILDQYASQVSEIIVNDLQSDETISEKWALLKSGKYSRKKATSVPPLVETTWAQSPYYNDLCPEDSNGKAVTGCVATTMAQLIRYWSYPLQGKGSVSYKPKKYKDILSVNFEEEYYDYASMPLILTGSSTAAEINAVAKLNLHCGIAVEMDYDINASGAYSIWPDPCAVSALRDHFKYDSVKGHYRENYNDQAWIDLLKADLNKDRPVYYAASDPANGGHAFICDGYNEEDYFHFNWGWGGFHDGYFLVSSLTPNPYSFSDAHRAITGIYPVGELMASMTSSFFEAGAGEISACEKMTISSNQLIGNIIIQTELPFEISIDSIHWSTKDSILADHGVIHVRYRPEVTAYDRGKVVLTNINASPLEVILEGTSCLVIRDFPWMENFEDQSVLDCWFVNDHGVYGKWEITGENDVMPPYRGDRYLFYSAHGMTSDITAPLLDLTHLQKPTLYFSHFQKSYASYIDQLSVYYRTAPGEAWNLLKKYTETINEWTLDTLELPFPTSTYSIAFKGFSNLSGIGVDNIIIADSVMPRVVTSVAGLGGTIFPEGDTLVMSGSSLSYIITPNFSYKIFDILVNGESKGALTTFTLEDIDEDIRVEAIFEYVPDPKILIDTASLSFFAMKGKEELKQIAIRGHDLTSSIHVVVNGKFEILNHSLWDDTLNLPKEGGILNIRYTPDRVGTDTAKVVFTSPGAPLKTLDLFGESDAVWHSISSYSTSGGYIYPPGTISVEDGDSIKYTIVPDPGYILNSYFIDGNEVGNNDTIHVFRNVSQSHIIYAIFDKGVSLKERESGKIQVYPNPVIQKLYFPEEHQYNTYIITDLAGKVLLEGSIQGNEIIVSSLSAGIYILQCRGMGNDLLIQKIIKHD